MWGGPVAFEEVNQTAIRTNTLLIIFVQNITRSLPCRAGQKKNHGLAHCELQSLTMQTLNGDRELSFV